MIDWERVDELRQEIGAEDFDEVVDLFLDEVEEVIGRLQDGPDMANLEADLHFLKGGALNLGFQTFSQLCQAGEAAAAAGKGETVDLAAILTAFEDSKNIFAQTLAAA
ncbi:MULTISPECIES: Hpt domain-containing protein [unclassified Shimia]|uniref:Hpt domain-containing protein n=1 Tax=unclassified Shimia TaxID=2630038 RepID=UPI001ADAE64D|nr:MULTISPECIES: Hpt domain-containing protein [unclassified Shimia]MBO9473217.1 Hpt domain-containing protein [Shimia sp. R10_1]MDA5556913.1 Hpt domain-containing protein [Shimia sp. MMG029]